LADQLGNLVIEAPLTITHATAASVVVPRTAMKMYVTCADAMQLRLSETGNHFRIPPDDTFCLEVSSLANQTLWLYNPAHSGSSVVTILFVTRQAI
jgi:hypothetical protein